ncbi:DgyrCDS8152 [Dimorphilus gyrociliatus]|uniref:DgyrCDS8152 n=1 Tax=Dimorphilus gyrociliatus TaxID=2664684 RepID=A0A7I8VTC1_9ANNE|nr:DgyrCDS8152 [Dimorphilus gyrociliatus]
MPKLFNSKIIFFTLKNQNNSKSNCKIEWPDNKVVYELSHTILQLIFGLIFPIFAIVASYILLIRRIKRMARWKLTTSIQTPNRKMTRLVIGVVAAFVALHTPLYIMEIVQMTKKMEASKSNMEAEEWEVYAFVYCNLIAQMAVYINSALNPILYFLLNENFRRMYKMTLCPQTKANNTTNNGIELNIIRHNGSDEIETKPKKCDCLPLIVGTSLSRRRKQHQQLQIEMTEDETRHTACFDHKNNYK